MREPSDTDNSQRAGGGEAGDAILAPLQFEMPSKCLQPGLALTSIPQWLSPRFPRRTCPLCRRQSDHFNPDGPAAVNKRPQSIPPLSEGWLIYQPVAGLQMRRIPDIWCVVALVQKLPDWGLGRNMMECFLLYALEPEASRRQYLGVAFLDKPCYDRLARCRMIESHLCKRREKVATALASLMGPGVV